MPLLRPQGFSMSPRHKKRIKMSLCLCLHLTRNPLPVPKRCLLALPLRRLRRSARFLFPRLTLPLSPWSHLHHLHRVLLLLPQPQDHGLYITCVPRHHQSPATAKRVSQLATAAMTIVKRTFSTSPAPLKLHRHHSTVIKRRIPLLVLVRQRLQRLSRAGASSLPSLMPPL